MDTQPILGALGDIRENLGEMRAEGRGRDATLIRIEALIAAHVAADEKVAKRVSVLEHARSRATGYVLALSAIGGIAVTGGVAIAKALI